MSVLTWVRLLRKKFYIQALNVSNLKVAASILRVANYFFDEKKLKIERH